MQPKTRRVGNIVNDLEVFRSTCDYIKQGDKKTSLASIARKLDMTSAGLIECLKRLNVEYGNPLIETRERFRYVRITDVGNIAYEAASRLFDSYDSLKTQIKNLASEVEIRKRVVKISVSPYLLAHVLPAAAASFSNNVEGKVDFSIECEEGYYTQDVLRKVSSGENNFAVLWNYPEKIREIQAHKHVTCVLSSVAFQPVLVFGTNHRKFRELLEADERSFVDIAELADETVFMLEPAHQPLMDDLPAPGPSGHRIQFTSIASMVGSIRAGMPGVAIIPGIYKDLDRYRRDGSLYFLPITKAGIGSEKGLKIRLLYVIPGVKSGWNGDVPPPYEDEESLLYGINSHARSFLKFLEKHALPNLLKGSAWSREFPRGLDLSKKDVLAFKYFYHVSPKKMGKDAPSWFRSDAEFEQTDKDRYRGVLKLCKDGDVECRSYELEAELIDKQIFCVRGFYATQRPDGGGLERTGEECFVAVMMIMSHDKDYVLGVVAAQDDEGTSPMLSTVIFSKKDVNKLKDLEVGLQYLKNRALIRTDVTSRFYLD